MEHEPVAYLSYDYLGLPIEFGLRGGRSERTFGDAVVEAGTLQEFDYTETLGHGEFRLGRGCCGAGKLRERHSATQHWTSCPGSRSPSWGATWSC